MVEILHLAYTRFPADTRVKREVAALQSLGRRIAIVALRASYEPAVERRAGVTIIRVQGRKSRGGVASYLLEYLAFVWRVRRLVNQHRALTHVKIVHVHTLPDFLIWAALPAKRRGAHVVFDMHEIFPEFIQTKFGGVLGRVVARLALRIERWARNTADLTISVNHPIDELLMTRPLNRPERRLIVHNTADSTDFGDFEIQKASGATNLALVYHGTLTALYGVDVAIRAVAEARRLGLPVSFTILGDGPERGALERLVSQLELTGVVTFERPLPQSELPMRLRQCTAGIVPTRLDRMTRYSLSNKLLEYVHLGIPVLASQLPSYSRYFDHESVWYWRPNEWRDLARAIGDFAAASQEERSERALRASRSITPFAWARERRALVSAYADLLASVDSQSERIAAMRSAAVPSP